MNKMRSLPGIISHFRNMFNKNNNTGARMIDFIYHLKFKLFCNYVFGVKTSKFCQIYAMLVLASFQNVIKIYKTTSCSSILLHGHGRSLPKIQCTQLFGCD